MKLLLDENLSERLTEQLYDAFPLATHVKRLGMERATDAEIWTFARSHGFTIVTRDADFFERSVRQGFPPKVIWLRGGNTSTAHTKLPLSTHREQIQRMLNDPNVGCIEIKDKT